MGESMFEEPVRQNQSRRLEWVVMVVVDCQSPEDMQWLPVVTSSSCLTPGVGSHYHTASSHAR